MANIHTNFLTGNDSTGNGSTTLPYKTVTKALSVAINGDVIKVAGSDFTTASATPVTVNARATTITTSVDLTGQFAPGDSIFFDTAADDGFPMAANGFVIVSITSSLITLGSNAQLHIKPGSYIPYKLSTYHYSAASGNFELFNLGTPTATDVTIEGGWDATYTTQVGWTGVKTAASSGVANFIINAWNFIRPNIVWNNFLFSNINNAFGASTAAAIGINKVAFCICSTPFGTNNFGVHAPSSIGFSTIYSVGARITESWNGGANRPVTWNCKQWVTGSSGTVTNRSLKVGYASGEGALAGPSIKILDAYWRSLGSQVNTSIWAPIAGSTIGDVYIDNLTMYVGGSSISPICNAQLNTQAWKYVNNLNVVNIDGTRSGITPFTNLNSSSQNPVGQIPLYVGKTTGVIEDLPWMSYGSPQLMNTYLQCQNPAIYCKDSQGQKVINSDSIVKYADPVEYVTGSNSLRFKLTTNTTGTDLFHYFCGILNKPAGTSPFTITIKVKASKAITIDSIGVQYGMSGLTATNAVPSTTSITTSWQNITCTITPTGLTSWTTVGDELLKTSIRINSLQIANQNEVAYLYVDSVTIS